ncbi:MULTISPECIES: metallophosphoesterase [Streptomyces]|uniref:Metallophosphoesterase n=1 Tax=Streptomyces koelreuteriae TaxID=2838015 RepID=A0ABX8FQS8_9ACTN|nr:MULTISPECIES: metallophosphoesterase [Streptomyces]QWB23498.1 metallophosphoesterase [Streptomyces koelreuteriae]UUA06453.1 metallophosphoesterase [Streptomyces koelreuteriae]UUA14082.1 metallophosphoesterase [Streptomyces sp. CRCS-T-1]
MAIVFVLVALLVLAVVVTANWYVWRRLFRDTTRGPGLTRRAGAVLIAGGWALAITALVAERSGAPFWLQQTLAWPGFLWLALSIYLLLAVLAGELVRPLLRRFLECRDRSRTDPGTAPTVSPAAPLNTEQTPHTPATSDEATAPPQTGVGAAAPGVAAAAAAQAASRGGATASATESHPRTEPTPDTPETPEATPQPLTLTGTTDTTPAPPTGPSRRLFVSRVVAGAAAAAAVGTVGYGTYGVLRGPKVRRVTVPLAKLPRAAHGFRIAVVSDVHLGPVLGRGFAQTVVDTINATQPDLIAVVGDLVDGSVKDLGPAAAPLAGLKARHGSYFVTGNHEYFSGAEQWVEEVRSLGINPLENARRELPYFDLAGVNDIAGEEEGQGPDFARALGDRDTARACVLLAHQPVQIHDAVEHGVDLQLSGHTHGGQLWPGNLIASAANPTLAGLERYGDTQLYVSRGAGAWGPPTRVGAPSDITLIELASKQA